MHYHSILNTPQIHKVIKVQAIELFIFTILSVAFLTVMIPDGTTFANLGEQPLVKLVRWLIIAKVIWSIINIRFLSIHKLHWYRFI